LAPFVVAGSNPLVGQDSGTGSTAAIGDLDGDGDPDIVAGEANGTFLYLANTGSAEAPAFAVTANPLAGQDVGAFSSPALGDLDGDGDLDLVAGEQDGRLLYYENTGSVTSPAFTPITGAANPLDGEDVGTYSAPSLGDLDRDGDLDLVVGSGSGGFRYFENTVDADTPVFVERTGVANPLDGQDIGGGSTPALGDLDGDGDLDLIAGEDQGALFAFENTGSATSPAFAARTGAANPLDGQDVGTDSTTALGDLDGDGDPDLVAGEFDGLFNTLFNRAGSFTPRTGAANPLASQDVGVRSTTALGDLDADGLLDLISGNNSGQFNYFENTGSATSPAFAGVLLAPDIGSLSAPALGDLDDDGDLDLVSGDRYGEFFYFKNTGSAASPAFLEQTGSANPLNTQDVGNQSAPSFGDLDGDGDLDLVSGEYSGTFLYFENTGDAANPAFVPSGVAFASPLSGEFYSKPSLADVDRDGDLDLVAGGYVFHYFENTGSASVAHFVHRTGAANPLVNQLAPTPISFPSPSLGDLDGDGDLDLVSGKNDGGFAYYARVHPETPPMIELTGGANPLFGKDVGALAGPALADLDADGDADLVVGEDLGTFRFFENTHSATNPQYYVERTGGANPLNGRDVGNEARPAFGDLDGDGDLDLLAGRSAGDFDYFANTGSATVPLFAALVENPFGLAGIGSASSSPALGDIDGDGDLDLVVGGSDGALTYFENTGSATAPVFVERAGNANPLEALALPDYTSPTIGDFDDDGDLDVIVGGSFGGFLYLQNGGGVTDPDFARRTGSVNPLDGVDVGDRAAPATADLDGDGDADLVTGSLAGTFAVHYLPEPVRGLLLGAGMVLLRLLTGRRGRDPR
jgi:hypothetical protein